MKNISLITVLFFASVVTMACAPTAIAQTQINTTNSAITTIPEFPGSFQEVRADISGLGIDFTRANISWFVNNEFRTSGFNKTNFAFRTGAAGEVTNIAVFIEIPGGQTTQATLRVVPADVSLAWEPLSYTPPFYKGAPLYSYETPLHVVAIPNLINTDGKKIPDSDLVYMWSENDNPLQNLSGVGKDTILLKSKSPLQETTVSVTVSTYDKKISASQRVTISPINPQVILYEKSPLYGILWNKAQTNSTKLTANEMTLVAIPYFFNTNKANNSKLNFNWNLNGLPIQSTGSNNTITLRQTTNSAGAANINLQVTNDIGIFQQANTSLSLIFGNNTNNTNLGF